MKAWRVQVAVRFVLAWEAGERRAWSAYVDGERVYQGEDPGQAMQRLIDKGAPTTVRQLPGANDDQAG